jgi:peptidylprolyl isomerase
MKKLIFLAAAITVAANAQTQQKTPGPISTTVKTSVAAHTASISTLPPGVPRLAHGPLTTAFALRYEDIKVGTGPVAEPNKLYKVAYTGWLAATGVKFDSSYDHPAQPIIGTDAKPEMGPDGKPKMAPGQPMIFPQGMGRLIPGFDQGFTGMRIGGKRRLFIPWQLAYGTRDMPAHGPDHPGIPPKSDLIFDVELVDVMDFPAPPTRPVMGARPIPGGVPPHPTTPTPVTPPSGSTAPTSPSAAPAQPAMPSHPPAPSTPPPSSTTPPQSK